MYELVMHGEWEVAAGCGCGEVESGDGNIWDEALENGVQQMKVGTCGT